MDIVIQPASPEQAPELSKIALQAKGHWGYSQAQLERWRGAFLTIMPEYIQANQVWMALIDNQIVGFAAVKQQGAEVMLDHLWVLPAYIGQGIGRRLFYHVAATVLSFVFTSDPHADAFYYKLGARKIGDYYSVLQERMLTKFQYTANANGDHP